MTEALTSADFSTLIYWGLGMFAVGFTSGRLYRAIQQFLDMS